MSRWTGAPRLQGLRDEWRSNKRLRIGVVLITAILFLYMMVVLYDWRQSLHRQYQQRTVDLYKMAQLANQQQWLARAQEASKLHRALEAEIPKASSVGIAQAEVQSYIQQVISAFGKGLATEAKAPVQVSGRSELWRIPVSVAGIVQPKMLVEILRRIEGGQRLATIEEFSLVMQQGRPVMSMTVVAYYRIGPDREGADAIR